MRALIELRVRCRYVRCIQHQIQSAVANVTHVNLVLANWLSEWVSADKINTHSVAHRDPHIVRIFLTQTLIVFHLFILVGKFRMNTRGRCSFDSDLFLMLLSVKAISSRSKNLFNLNQIYTYWRDILSVLVYTVSVVDVIGCVCGLEKIQAVTPHDIFIFFFAWVTATDNRTRLKLRNKSEREWENPRRQKQRVCLLLYLFYYYNISDVNW